MTNPMKRWFRNAPIKRKLTFVILSACALVLSLAWCALTGFEVLRYRDATAREMTVIADVVARNTVAALSFEDIDGATETLRALESEPEVEAACLFNAEGAAFARYVRKGSTAPLPPFSINDGYRFERSHLLLYRPVILNGKRIGTLGLQAGLEGMYDRIQVFLLVGIVVLIVTMLIALLVASLVQRPISGPILALQDTARRITEDQDFRIRASATGTDEIGMLTNTFNQMLAVIEEREDALSSTNEHLLDEVGERTRAEDKAHAQLTRLDLLRRITHSIGERQDLPSIFQVVVRRIEDDLPLDFSCVCLYAETEQALTLASVGIRSESLATGSAMAASQPMSIKENGLERCLQGSLVYEPDLRNVQQPFSQQLAQKGLRSLVIAPLLVNGRMFGVLMAGRFAEGAFSSPECEFLRQLSEHVALAANQAQLHGSLQQAYDDLHRTQQSVMQQERLRALGQMASGIAHDINNAISPVALYTEVLLEREPGLSERARRYLTTIQRAVEDVAQTVSRMREFYRHREPQSNLTSVQLNVLVEQVVDLTRARWSDMAQRQGIVIELKKQLSSTLPVIKGIESEIREALTNLIFNAVDSMPEGGLLTLRTGTRMTGTADDPGLVTVEVTDTGVGMDEETRSHCLEPFFTTKGERGTGLGLAMVYGMVQRHHGDIEIESVEGRGTTVRLLFAVSPRGEKAIAAAGGSHAAPVPLRLLVVDDDPLLIRSLRDTLEGDGHDVTTATGGAEGIAAFREAQAQNHPFEVVITDLGMPWVDGRRVAETIKELSPPTFVILLTGWGERLTAEGDIPPSVNRVLNKPPRVGDLRAALNQCVPVTH